MKKLLLLSIFISYAVWSCKKSTTEETPAVKTLCDSVTYDLMVKPILTVHCNQAICHAGSAGGIDLRTYSLAKKYTQTGNLIECINHEQGFKPMPEGLPKLSQRQLDIFDCWEAKGCPQ